MIVLDSSHNGFVFNLNAFLSNRDEDTKTRIKADPVISAAVKKVKHLKVHKAYPILAELYDPKGRKAIRQFEILRSLVLMPHFGCFSITQWHSMLCADRLIAGICGFFDDDIPSLGSFYNFIDRIVHTPKTSHIQPKDFNVSESLKQEQQSRKKNRKKRKEKWGDSSNPKVSDLVESYLNNPDSKELNRPEDCLMTLFRKLGIDQSIEYGLIDPTNITVGGDGTAVHEHATSGGTQFSAVENLLRYSDPDARWGYDSDLESFFYGYHACLPGTRPECSKKDLPLFFSLNPANMHDSIPGVNDLISFHRLNGDLTVSKVCLDSAHDNEPTYQLIKALGAESYIDVNYRRKKTGNGTDFSVDSNGGTVTCPAGLQMVCSGWDKHNKCYKYRCPVHVKKTGITECPLGKECSSSKSGRWYNLYPVSLRADGIARSQTAKWREVYKNRTTCERLNKRILNDYGLHKTYIRSYNVLFFLLFAGCMNVHMDAWCSAK